MSGSLYCSRKFLTPPVMSFRRVRLEQKGKITAIFELEPLDTYYPHFSILTRFKIINTVLLKKTYFPSFPKDTTLQAGHYFQDKLHSLVPPILYN